MANNVCGDSRCRHLWRATILLVLNFGVLIAQVDVGGGRIDRTDWRHDLEVGRGGSPLHLLAYSCNGLRAAIVCRSTANVSRHKPRYRLHQYMYKIIISRLVRYSLLFLSFMGIKAIDNLQFSLRRRMLLLVAGTDCWYNQIFGIFTLFMNINIPLFLVLI